jgi:hypothetical protein
MQKFKIGDYIYYMNEYYNGRGYSYNQEYGCIVTYKEEKNIADVIKQYGGKIWFGVQPKGKIDEENFLSKFSLYNENKESILKIKDKIPEKFKLLIEKKIDNDIIKIIKKVFNYSLKNILKNRYEKIKISPESWYIQWYIYNLYRQYEPHFINNTINYCYGASDLIKDFMKDNIDFMINMQFLSEFYENIMIFLIEEKILEYRHKKNIISDNYFSKNSFPIIIKKLEKYLNFKILNPYKKFILNFEYNKNKYEIEIEAENLFNTQFLLVNKNNKYYINSNSKCTNKQIFTKEFLNDMKVKDKNSKLLKSETLKTKNRIVIYNSKSKILKIENENNDILYETKIKYFEPIIGNRYIINKDTHENIDIKTLKKNKIKHYNKSSSLILNKTEDIVIFIDSYSHGGIDETKKITLYSTKNGLLLGCFEFNYDSFECVFNISVEIA